MTISFRVVGIPQAQPRHRSFVLRGKGGKPILDKQGNPIVRVGDPHTAEGWKSALADVARLHAPALPIEGPIRVDLVLLFPRTKDLLRPRSPLHRMPHWKRPDRDNCDKAVLDTLSVLQFWRDDWQVCRGAVEKWYVAIGEAPGAEVRIVPLEAATGLAREDGAGAQQLALGGARS